MNKLKWMAANAAMAAVLVTGTALAQTAPPDPSPANSENAATPATPATPADPSTGTPATPATPASPAAKQGDDPLAPSAQEVAAEKDKAAKKKDKKPR